MTTTINVSDSQLLKKIVGLNKEKNDIEIGISYQIKNEDQDTIPIFQSLLEENRLEGLNINAKPENLNSILEALKTKNTSLQKISLYSVGINQRNEEELAEVLKEKKHLKRLDLSGNNISPQSLGKILQDKKDLEELYLTHTNTKSEGAKALAESLKENNSIKTIHLGDNEIGDLGAKTLSSVLGEKPSLRTLILTKNKIGEEGASALAKMILKNISVKDLYLTKNSIKVAGTKAIASILAKNHPLQGLELGNNEIGDDGLNHLAEGLKNNTNMKRLDVSENDITHVGMAHFSETMEKNQSIETLRLAGNKLGDKGVELFAKTLEKNKIIQKLDLSNNGVGDPGIKALAESLIENSSLQFVYLAGNDITDEGAKHIIDALMVNTTLMYETGVDGNINKDLIDTMNELIYINVFLQENLAGLDPKMKIEIKNKIFQFIEENEKSIKDYKKNPEKIFDRLALENPNFAKIILNKEISENSKKYLEKKGVKERLNEFISIDEFSQKNFPNLGPEIQIIIKEKIVQFLEIEKKSMEEYKEEKELNELFKYLSNELPNFVEIFLTKESPEVIKEYIEKEAEKQFFEMAKEKDTLPIINVSKTIFRLYQALGEKMKDTKDTKEQEKSIPYLVYAYGLELNNEELKSDITKETLIKTLIEHLLTSDMREKGHGGLLYRKGFWDEEKNRDEALSMLLKIVEEHAPWLKEKENFLLLFGATFKLFGESYIKEIEENKSRKINEIKNERAFLSVTRNEKQKKIDELKKHIKTLNTPLHSRAGTIELPKNEIASRKTELEKLEKSILDLNNETDKLERTIATIENYVERLKKFSQPSTLEDLENLSLLLDKGTKTKSVESEMKSPYEKLSKITNEILTLNKQQYEDTCKL